MSESDSSISNSFSQSGEELTPAASELLEQYSDGFRRRVVETARRLQRVGASEPLRMDSVREALGLLQSEVSQSAYRSRRLSSDSLRVVLMGVAFVGMIIFTVLAWMLIQADSSSSVLTAITTAFGGVLGVTVSVTTLILFRRREIIRHETAILESYLLRDVEELELVARQFVQSVFLSDELEFASLSEVLGALEKTRVWTPGDVESFRSLLRLRGRIVHELKGRVDVATISNALALVKRLHDRLRSQSNAIMSNSEEFSAGGLGYQRRVADALGRLFDDERVSESLDQAYDFMIDLPMGIVLVALKYRQNGEIRVRDISSVVDSISLNSQAGMVIVTNSPLSSAVKQLNQSTADGNFEIVNWNVPEDDGILSRAIARQARGSMPVRGGARFEIYQDAKGMYRFRLKAQNGEILATGESFQTLAGVRKQIDKIRSAVQMSETISPRAD